MRVEASLLASSPHASGAVFQGLWNAVFDIPSGGEVDKDCSYGPQECLLLTRNK